jgi:hypothetical protein
MSELNPPQHSEPELARVIEQEEDRQEDWTQRDLERGREAVEWTVKRRGAAA